MKKILSLIIIVVFLLACAAVYFVRVPAMKAEAEAAAKTELEFPIDAAFRLLAETKAFAKELDERADREILAKAHAAERIVTHDDSVLNESALKAIAEQLDLIRVDYVSVDGIVLASSDQANAGRNIAEEDRAEWFSELADDRTAAYAGSNALDGTLRIGCVQTTDGNGYLLVTEKNGTVAAADAAAQPENVFRAMSYLADAGELIDAPEPAGVIEQDGVYRVVRTQDGLTVKAERKLADMYYAADLLSLAVIAIAVTALLSGGLILLLNWSGSARTEALPETEETLENPTEPSEVSAEPSELFERPAEETETEAPMHPEMPAEKQAEMPDETREAVNTPPEDEPSDEGKRVRELLLPKEPGEEGISIEEMIRRIEAPAESDEKAGSWFSADKARAERPKKRRREELAADEAPAERPKKRRREEPAADEAPAERPKKRRREELAADEAPAERPKKRRREEPAADEAPVERPKKRRREEPAADEMPAERPKKRRREDLAADEAPAERPKKRRKHSAEVDPVEAGFDEIF